MKLVTARIQPHRLNSVHEALVKIGITSLTASDIKGFREEVSHAEILRGAAYKVDFLPMVKIEAIVEDDVVEQVTTAIRHASAADPARYSRIWISDVMAAKTGEAAP
jgi:nitrogen regulatory protein P-II 1